MKEFSSVHPLELQLGVWFRFVVVQVNLIVPQLGIGVCVFLYLQEVNVMLTLLCYCRYKEQHNQCK